MLTDLWICFSMKYINNKKIVHSKTNREKKEKRKRRGGRDEGREGYPGTRKKEGEEMGRTGKRTKMKWKTKKGASMKEDKHMKQKNRRLQNDCDEIFFSFFLFYLKIALTGTFLVLSFLLCFYFISLLYLQFKWLFG